MGFLGNSGSPLPTRWDVWDSAPLVGFGVLATNAFLVMRIPENVGFTTYIFAYILDYWRTTFSLTSHLVFLFTIWVQTGIEVVMCGMRPKG